MIYDTTRQPRQPSRGVLCRFANFKDSKIRSHKLLIYLYFFCLISFFFVKVYYKSLSQFSVCGLFVVRDVRKPNCSKYISIIVR